ncbi:hypothetical protein F3157_18330 [Virgibacillus dakarensis]|nr:hypothetical protein [Virgibacillus dakarensis]MTW87579.1 hypothetical protein [Virgibacillus dakarensis]
MLYFLVWLGVITKNDAILTYRTDAGVVHQALERNRAYSAGNEIESK